MCVGISAYLHCVRLLGVLEVYDTEEQRIFGAVQQHQGGALRAHHRHSGNED